MSVLFCLFSACAVCGALGVILVKNYFNSLMCMLLCTLGLGCLMIYAGAAFAGILMIMIYAGAIMVLFMFVVMLVGDDNSNACLRCRIKLIVMWALMMLFAMLLAPECAELKASVAAQESVAAALSAKSCGVELFSRFLLPFQITGALLLAAMVGVIVVAQDKPRARKYKRDMI